MQGAYAIHGVLRSITLEIRPQGRAGSERGKFLQACSPLSHLIKAAGAYEVKPPDMGPNKPRRLSGFYTTKTNAARAIVAWCGADWRNRVETLKVVDKSLPAVEVLEEVKEAQISLDVKGFRTATVKWWQSKLSPEVIRADLDGSALAIVEDDLLVKELQDIVAKHCFQEHVRDSLEQGLKCETDTWDGNIIWLGSKAVDNSLKPHNRTIPIFTYADLQDKEDLPADCGLVHKDAHFIPFWRKQWHGPAVARPWLEEDSLAFAPPFRELHLDVTTRAAGDCLQNGCLVILGMPATSRQKGLEEEGGKKSLCHYRLIQGL